MTSPDRVAVVGGGIAGVAAAAALAERGLRVTLIEAEGYLGGRAGAWTTELATGEQVEMERGFHAFFRQYYSLRRLLRRIDPALAMLTPTEDYPILGPDGESESFADLPHTAPFNVIALTRRTKSMGLRDLLRVDARAAARMLAFDGDATYARFDDLSAAAYLDSLRFPPRARRMLFDVFAHSFFNPERAMSAAELLMMFHFYFMGNREGLVFDVVDQPMSTAIWRPFERYLDGIGVELQLGRRAERIARENDRWRVDTDSAPVPADAVVLAVTVPALAAVVSASPDLAGTAAAARWREQIGALDVTLPFAVWRLWLDRPTRAGRAPFVGTTGLGMLDNVSLYHLFQGESRAWAQRTGGAVVELHAYAVAPAADEAAIKRDTLAGLHAVYPELAGAGTIDERFLLRRDCPAFARGSYAARPGVETPFRDLALAGDFVKLPFPSALMERAAASGFAAANTLLSARGLAPEPIETIATRGLLAPLFRPFGSRTVGERAS